MADVTKVRLDGDDFTSLVRGEEINKNGVSIILSDIGYTAMEMAVHIAKIDSLRIRFDELHDQPQQ